MFCVITLPVAVKHVSANDVFECPIIVMDVNRTIASVFNFIKLSLMSRKSRETKVGIVA